MAVRGKVELRPQLPAANALIFGEGCVGAINRGLRLLRAAVKQQHGYGFGACMGFRGNHGGGFHSGLAVQRRFHVLGMNVEPCGGHDGFALAAEEMQIAFAVLLGQVAGGEPGIGERLHAAVLPAGGGHHLATHLNFAIAAHANLTARKRLADSSLGKVKGMIEGDERCGLRHAIALNERKAKIAPEALQAAEAARLRHRQRPRT